MNTYDLFNKAIRMYKSCETFKQVQHTDTWVEMAEKDFDFDMGIAVNRERYAKIYELKRVRPEHESRWWNRLEHLKFRKAWS
jgi:hypothetical protein